MEKSFEAVKEVEEAGCLLIKTFVERERERRQKTVFVKFHNFNIEILKLESERYEIVIIKKQVSANSKYLNMTQINKTLLHLVKCLINNQISISVKLVCTCLPTYLLQDAPK